MLRDFFGYECNDSLRKDSIIINRENPALFPAPVFGFFETDKNFLPDWADDSFGVVLPKIFKNKSTGTVIASFKVNSQKYPIIVRDENHLVLNFDPLETLRFLNLEGYLSPEKNKSVFRKLPVPTNVMPGFFKDSLRGFFTIPLITKLLKKCFLKSKYPFPAWPIEKSADTIRFILLKCLANVFKAGTKTMPF